MANIKPTPPNQSQITQAAIPPPYLINEGKPTSRTVFTQNRAKQFSRKNDKVKDITVGLQDIDYAIKYYFDEVIKPQVTQDGNLIKVPVDYASPERWKSVQADGYYRDTNGKVVLPLILYKRDNVEKNRSLGNKIDGNKVHLFQVFETRYNPKNIYDNFSVLTNRIPSKQFYVSVVPDYVTVTYSVNILTNFVEQNNKIVEAIEFASDSYWGDVNRWHFRTMLDSLATTTTINTGEDRFALTTVTLRVNGYLIPDSINKELANEDLFYSTSQVVFGVEATTDLTTVDSTTQMADNNTVGSTSFIGDGNIIYNTYISAAALSDLEYLNTNKPLKADVITVPNQALFTGAIILEPSVGSQLPATTVNNFVFYINGQYIPSSFVTFVPDILGVRIQFNTSLVGYTLEADDEVVAVGTFV